MKLLTVNDWQLLRKELREKYGFEKKGSTVQSLFGILLFITITALWIYDVSFALIFSKEIDLYSDNTSSRISINGSFFNRDELLSNDDFKEKIFVPSDVIRSVISMTLFCLLGKTFGLTSLVILNFSRKLYILSMIISAIIAVITGIQCIYDGIINMGMIICDETDCDDYHVHLIKIIIGFAELIYATIFVRYSSETITKIAKLPVRQFSRNDVFRFRYLIAFAVSILTMTIGILATCHIVIPLSNEKKIIFRIVCSSWCIAIYLYCYGRAVLSLALSKTSSSSAVTAVPTKECIFIVTRYHMGTLVYEAICAFVPMKYEYDSIFLTSRKRLRISSRNSHTLWIFYFMLHRVVFVSMCVLHLFLNYSTLIVSCLTSLRVAHPDNSGIVQSISTYWTLIMTLSLSVPIVLAMLAHVTLDVLISEWISREEMSEHKISNDKSSVVYTVYSKEYSQELKSSISHTSINT